jgi:hypothetical protein
MNKLFCLIVCLFPVLAAAQTWSCFFEQNYYTSEVKANLIIIPPAHLSNWPAKVRLEAPGFPIIDQLVQLEKETRIPVALAPVLDSTLVEISIQMGTQTIRQTAVIRKLTPKANAVKINRLYSSLIVDDLPYFPLGFYCYPPVQATLAEEEVVRGFNMISPYQKIAAATLPERLLYLDRCAALGMKVHYNLLSIAGGGGVGQGRADYQNTQRLALLQQEILMIKDHPALLGWYICDEPTGQNIQPEALLESYQLIKKLDPYHPISIVFMNPKAAVQYRAVMDIVMADPYPIPNRHPKEVGDIIQALADVFQYDIPVWLVPQAFGGSEHWAREPSPSEIRLMTWLGVLHGATGIQYFIRHGLSSFPKSSLTWDAASAAIKEIKNLSPFLLQAEEAQVLKAPDNEIEAKWYRKNGQVMLVVLNTNKNPKNFVLKLDGLHLPNTAKVLFEDRAVQVNKDRLQDIIEGYGRRIYQFDLQAQLSVQAIYDQNILIDPSFENSLVPGTPAACYFKLRGDRGAHAQLDTRTAVEGRHSLLLTTPSYNNGIDVSLFPVQLEKGQSYALTFWAKGSTTNQEIFFKLGNGAERKFPLRDSWQPYQWVFKAQGNEATRNSKTGIIFSLITPGNAWLDVVQLLPEPRIEFVNQPFATSTEVKIATVQSKDPSISINYTIDGGQPNITSPPYTGPLQITRPLTIKASVSKGNERFVATEDIMVNMLKVDAVRYQQAYYEKFAAAGDQGLVDGQFGSLRFTDGHWQGWNKGNIDLFLDFKEEQAMQQLHLNFLIDHTNWIYPPERIEIYASKNGKRYKKIAEQQLPKPVFNPVARIHRASFDLGNESYQSIQVVAIRPTSLPVDHPSSGGNPFVFMDEVMVSSGTRN